MAEKRSELRAAIEAALALGPSKGWTRSVLQVLCSEGRLLEGLRGLGLMGTARLCREACKRTANAALGGHEAPPETMVLVLTLRFVERELERAA